MPAIELTCGIILDVFNIRGCLRKPSIAGCERDRDAEQTPSARAEWVVKTGNPWESSGIMAFLRRRLGE
jgi:hypothetical protein